ncbi:MAG: hypothetical protein G01um101425_46 [Candidatus Peregrinibacteria bacterium Gr01-1014_25]|nr:MAG: hypothetical protein G01um101425_46 [Candidatus Peregrinibacteria bacterium Gr01-1014_25]
MAEVNAEGQQTTLQWIESAFHDAYPGLLVYLQQSMGLSREDAEDVVQRACIKMWQKYENTNLNPPIAMLTAIAKNMGRSIAREKLGGWKRNWCSIEDIDISSLIAPDQPPLTMMIEGEMRAKLQEVLDAQLHLPAPVNFIVSERLRGKTFFEIAEALLPMSPEIGDLEKLHCSVRVCFHRYKQTLRRLLQDCDCTLEGWSASDTKSA